MENRNYSDDHEFKKWSKILFWMFFVLISFIFLIFMSIICYN